MGSWLIKENALRAGAEGVRTALISAMETKAARLNHWHAEGVGLGNVHKLS